MKFQIYPESQTILVSIDRSKFMMNDWNDNKTILLEEPQMQQVSHPNQYSKINFTDIMIEPE